MKNVVMAIFIFGHSPLPFSDFMHTRRVHSRGIFNASRQVTSRHVGPVLFQSFRLIEYCCCRSSVTFVSGAIERLSVAPLAS